MWLLTLIPIPFILVITVITRHLTNEHYVSDVVVIVADAVVNTVLHWDQFRWAWTMNNPKIYFSEPFFKCILHAITNNSDPALKKCGESEIYAQRTQPDLKKDLKLFTTKMSLPMQIMIISSIIWIR